MLSHIGVSYTVGKLRDQAFSWTRGHDRVFVSMVAAPMWRTSHWHIHCLSLPLGSNFGPPCKHGQHTSKETVQVILMAWFKAHDVTSFWPTSNWADWRHAVQIWRQKRDPLIGELCHMIDPWLPLQLLGGYLWNRMVDFAHFWQANLYDRYDMSWQKSLPCTQYYSHERISWFPWQPIGIFERDLDHTKGRTHTHNFDQKILV